MKSKWYFGAFFLILCICFGAFQEQVSARNQEIILEFVDSRINQKEISSTIADVKEKLINIGVSNILIQETKKGTLKISYYSATDINNIKEVLEKENQLALQQNSDNEQEKLPSSIYNIDIYDLTDEIDATNLNDKYVLEIKYVSEQSTTTNTFASIRNLEIEKANLDYKTAYTIYKSNPFTKDKTSCKEPEVRAGPNFFNS